MRVGSLLSKPSLQAAETDLWENATQYINQERLKYAVYLLAQTDREILDICECCGFSNVSHFYHLFREQFGVSPAKFRKTV